MGVVIVERAGFQQEQSRYIGFDDILIENQSLKCVARLLLVLSPFGGREANRRGRINTCGCFGDVRGELPEQVDQARMRLYRVRGIRLPLLEVLEVMAKEAV